MPKKEKPYKLKIEYNEDDGLVKAIIYFKKQTPTTFHDDIKSQIENPGTVLNTIMKNIDKFYKRNMSKDYYEFQIIYK
jgi:hypothetical protein